MLFKIFENIKEIIIRASVNCRPPSDDLRIKVAASDCEKRQSFKIVHDAYVGIGYMKSRKDGIRVSSHHGRNVTNIIVAYLGGTMVGTITIVMDDVYGLPSDKDFDLNKLRGDGEVVAEYIALAIRKEYRHDNNILLPLMKYAYEMCVTYMGATKIVLATHPKNVAMYKALLTYKLLSDEVIYDKSVNGNPVNCMYLDIEETTIEMKRLYNWKFNRFNLYKYFKEDKFKQLEF